MRRSWDEELRFAHDLAGLADAITLPAFHRAKDVEHKADGTPVTRADRDAERAMRRAIAQHHPDHSVLGEEEGLHGPEDVPTWILDPIDGTKNFIRGIPVFATLVALAVDGRGVLAVISAPALDSRWDAVSNGPARQDGRQIRVSEVDDLAAAHVSFGGLGHFERRLTLEVVLRLARTTGRQRAFGDFWQHCLVASGGLEIAVEAEASRWDLAAPKVLVEAAGGRLTDLAGADTDAGGTALTTNGRLHEAALQALSDQ